eukprot:4789054-Prymnesium_polylepis.1
MNLSLTRTRSASASSRNVLTCAAILLPFGVLAPAYSLHLLVVLSTVARSAHHNGFGRTHQEGAHTQGTEETEYDEIGSRDHAQPLQGRPGSRMKML